MNEIREYILEKELEGYTLRALKSRLLGNLKVLIKMGSLTLKDAKNFYTNVIKNPMYGSHGKLRKLIQMVEKINKRGDRYDKAFKKHMTDIGVAY